MFLISYRNKQLVCIYEIVRLYEIAMRALSCELLGTVTVCQFNKTFSEMKRFSASAEYGFSVSQAQIEVPWIFREKCI